MIDTTLPNIMANIGLLAGGATIAITMASTMFKPSNGITKIWVTKLLQQI